MSKTKTKTVTSKPLPRLPTTKRKSNAGTTASSCASTPSKFYVSEQESFANNTESPARLARSTQGSSSQSSFFGFHSSATQQQRQHAHRIHTGSDIAHPWASGDRKDRMLPHLISQNTVTYHSNFFERLHLEEGEQEAQSSDPLEIEELQVELRSPAAGDPALAFGGNAETVRATSTPVAAHRLPSLVSLDSATASDIYQQHSRPSVSSLPPPLPSHRNRSYGVHPTVPGGHKRRGGSFPRKPVGLDHHFNVEGNWAFDAAGKAYFRGTGKIEEVQEGGQETIQEDQMTLKSPLGSTSTVLGLQNQPTTFETTSPLPPATSPPPRPRRVEQAVLSPGGTNFSIPKTLFGHTRRRRRVGLDVQLGLPMDWDVPLAGRNTPPSVPPPAALPVPPPEPVIQPDLEDLDLETQSLLQMLEHVDNGVKDVVALRDIFIRTCAVYPILRKHIDITYRVETALLSVHAAIDRRRNIPQSYLDIRTAEWQEKFELRLVSLRTTVQRLNALREFVEKRKKLTEKHLEVLFQRLLSHEMKYTDIASKLHASYDRLKLYHSHTLLEAAYRAEAEVHREHRARKRGSYLRKRTEARLERHAGAGAGYHERGPATTFEKNKKVTTQ